MGRQTAILLRAKRRISYDNTVVDELEILSEFPFSNRDDWSRHLIHAPFDGSQLRLDWLVHSGGPFRERLEQWVISGSTKKLVIGMRPDPVTEFEILHWLKTFHLESNTQQRPLIYLHSDLSGREYEKWNITLSRQVPVFRILSETAEFQAAREHLKVPLQSFLEKVLEFGKQRSDQSSPIGEKALEIYRRIWFANRQIETPWMLLRYWLRDSELRNLIGFKIHREIERLLVYLSPQNEILERESLALGQVMINPTLEIITQPQNRTSPLFAITRFRGHLIERELGVFEAALIDAIREDFRLSEERAIEIAIHESSGSAEEINRALKRLKMEGFVLSAQN